MKSALRMLVIVMIFCSCQNPSTELTEEQKRSITSELKQRLEGYREAAIKKDTEWFRNFWLNRSDFAFAFDAEYITDYDLWFKASYTDALPNIKEILHFKLGEGRAAVFSENAASYATTFDWGMVSTSNDTIQSKGSIVYVFTRIDGEWKCVQSGGTHKYY